MSKFFHQFVAVLVVCGGLLSINPVQAEDRPAEKILAEIKAVEMPPVPVDRNDRAAIQEFVNKRQKAMERRFDLIGELYKAYPDSAELPPLLMERWGAAGSPGSRGEEAKAEIETVLAKSKNPKLVAEAAFAKTAMAFTKAGQNADATTLLPLAEEFVKKAPKDDRAALLLNYVAGKMTDDTKRAALEKRIEKDFPDSPLVQQKIRLKAAEIRLKDAVGQPFKIEFTDAIKGGHVTMASLKGKVVIIDFWATWCPPCVADMPNMKKLYAEYRTKGVEFIGVSLDQPKDNGGYDLLKAFVEKNKIDWPQFYDPEGKHEFALDWGVNSIPTIFAVDADGNLASLDAAGQLETLIPNLLKKAEKSKKTQARP